MTSVPKIAAVASGQASSEESDISARGCTAGYITQVFTPKPGQAGLSGLSMASSYTCRRCEFVIVPGISSSMVTMFRKEEAVKPEKTTLVTKCPDKTVESRIAGIVHGYGMLNEQTFKRYRGGGNVNTGVVDGATDSLNSMYNEMMEGDVWRNTPTQCIQYKIKEKSKLLAGVQRTSRDMLENAVMMRVWARGGVATNFFSENRTIYRGGSEGKGETERVAIAERDGVWIGWSKQDTGGMLRLEPTGVIAKKVPAGDPAAVDANSIPSAKVAEEQKAFEASQAAAPPKIIKAKSLSDVAITNTYSAETKLFVKPSIPFKIRFNNVTYVVNLLSMYYPSPFRIENVQHDAVLSLNDASSPDSKIVILIPIVGGVMVKAAGRFVSKLVTFMSSLTGGENITDEASGEPVMVPVATGNDWNLTSLLPLKIVDDEPRVQAGYFTWDAKMYEQKVRTPKTGCYDYYDWTEIPGKTRKYIVIRQPIVVSHSDLYTIRRLPVTAPEGPIEPVPDKFVYNPGPADNCPECYGGGPGEVALPSFNVVPNNGVRNKNVVINILLGILSAVAIFIGIYFGVKWVTSDNGETFKWLGQKVGGFFGSFSAVGKSMGALAAPALVAMKKTSLPSFPMRRKSVAPAPAPAAPALPEMPSLSDVFPTPTTTPEASIKEFGLGDTIPIAPTGNFMVTNPLASRARTPRASMGPNASREKAQKQKEAAGTGLLSLGAMEALDEARATGKTPPGWRIKKNAAGEITDIKPINLSGGHGGSTRRVRH